MIFAPPSGALENSKQRLELADIFRRYGESFLQTHKLPLRHRHVMQQIMNCRTAVLGGHRQSCGRCGFERYLYHSCRNRHCPKCQTAAKEAWRAARQLELLPVPYFHNVFTLPHELNPLILRSESNQRLLLKLLFDAAQFNNVLSTIVPLRGTTIDKTLFVRRPTEIAFPRKGSVPIHVDGVDYRLRIRNRPTYSQALSEHGLVVTVQTETEPLCVLRVWLNCARPDNWIQTNNNSVVPCNVAAFMRTGHRKSGNPT